MFDNLKAALVVAALSICPQAMAETALGVPSYWGDQGDYDLIPEGGLALINPNSGILDESKQTLDIAPNAGYFGEIINGMKARGVEVYAYVPTGYFNHECNIYGECQTWERIVTQIYAYFELYPDLDGIFFDEAAGSGDELSCEDYALEYARLRGLVRRYKEDANIVFNPGWSNPCAVQAAEAGEIVLTFESAREKYTEYPDTTQGAIDLARERGVKTWHLVYSVEGEEMLREVVSEAKAFGADYFYSTEVGGDWQAGDNTWGAPAKLWDVQIELLQE